MANSFWKRVRGGSSGARLFAAYVTLVLVVAMVGPGLAVYGGEGDEVVPPEEVVTSVEPLVEEVVPEAPAPEEPVLDEAAIGEPPVAEIPVLASVEAPAVTAFAVGVAAVTSADPSDLGVIPSLVQGNPVLCVGGLRVDPGTPGTYAIPDHPGMFVTVVVTSTDDGPVFSFDSDLPVVRVVAKGGNIGANVYNYDPAVTADGSLHSPVNPSGGYAGLSHIDFCFGEIVEPEPGDLTVYKFLDADESTDYTDGEEMLENWEFTLFDSEDNEIDNGLTDESGMKTFADLEPGDYYVVETLTDGWDNTTPLSQDVTVVAGETAALWFGNIELESPPETGDLLIHKFLDDNENGEFDEGEEMLEDWEFTVTREGAPPVGIDAAYIMLIGVDVTNSDGELLFTGLEPGDDYVVTETLQDGWKSTTGGVTQDAAIVAGELTELWFGNVPERGDLLIHKYEDANSNSQFDEGEKMLEDWEFTVTLESPPIEEPSAAAIMLVGTGLTDSDGELLFSDLAPAEYTVTETLEDGWFNTTPLSQKVVVVDGETTEVWFGNVMARLTDLDLAITKLADDHTVDEGQLVKYTLTYWNDGDVVANNFTIVDDYDERYLSIVDAAGGVVAGGKITWTLPGPLAKADGKKTITYTARVSTDMPDATTNIDNVVVISHPQDSDPTNNRDDERVVYRVDEPFLPFTGSESLLLIAMALGTGTVGLALRTRPRRVS